MSKQFEWNDSLVAEFIQTRAGDQSLTDSIRLFKQEKSPKPEWEIVTVKGANGFLIHSYSFEHKECFAALVNGLVTYSVKRLSDNEIFSIGDYIEHSYEPTIKGKITHFYRDRELVWANIEPHKTTQFALANCIKVKEPIPASYSETGMKDFAKFHLNEMLKFWQTHEGEAMFPPMNIIFRQWQLQKSPE